MSRAEVLADLVAFSKPAEILDSLVRSLPWDAERPEITLTADHVRNVLNRFRAGELVSADVEIWADLIELREDIEPQADHEEAILHAIFVLATPSINGALDDALAVELIGSLSA